MIRQLGRVFVLDTDTTTYAFRVTETGHLEHLYYGANIRIENESEANALFEKHAFAPGNTNIFNKEHPEFTLEDMCLEMSSYGKSDIREPFIELVNADGSFTSNFLYDDAIISMGKKPLETLPSSYEENDDVMELTVILQDTENSLTLELHYYVFEQYDVISRASKLLNTSDADIHVKRLMSNQIDFIDDGYVMTTFNGGWASEMYRHDTPLYSGKHVNSSYTGCTSSRANSFIMIECPETTEDDGEVYGFHLIYSGNHYEAAEVSNFGKTRVVTGINPQTFDYILAPGENFESPEAVMTYSDGGFNGMSQHLHHFIRKCIVRGEWRDKVRPVLLNSWEAAYFDINEAKLLRLAKAGRDAGIELFVMDDGWFGKRDNDKSSLGDWYVNEKKLPDGVTGLAKKINDLGMDFGIWIEPEMVNEDSELYREHPDWAMEIPGKHHTEGRNQKILDFANPVVVDYMTNAMDKVLSSANIAYVKWDMNRIFSDYYSKYLPQDHQGEVAHRYIMGVYKMAKTLTEKYPHILFEGCAAGGNRFDLGILCYFPQIWASDDTDAVFRVGAQTSYSYGYPMSTVSAHVSSCPNHQTLRVTPLATRFAVASFGVCGYECNLCDMKKEDLDEIKAQIILYKEWREVLQMGDFYRGKNGNIHEWTCVAPDKSRAVGMLMQELVKPNTQFHSYKAKGLDADKRYHFFNLNKKYNVKLFGDLINTAAPIHVKPDSLLHNVLAKFVTMPGEEEDYILYGSALMKAGVKLKQAFSATGYSDQCRYFQDFSSRLYFMEEVELPSVQEETVVED